MVSQKSLSHSSRIVYAAPSLRPFVVPSSSRFLALFLAISETSLALVKAARGGLDGGDGIPVVATSGIPLCPCDELVIVKRARSRCMLTVRPGSGVVVTLQHR